MSVCKYLGKNSEGSYMHVWSTFRHSTVEFTKVVTEIDDLDPDDVLAERKQLKVLIDNVIVMETQKKMKKITLFF